MGDFKVGMIEGGEMGDDDNETWLIETGHKVITRKAEFGVTALSPRERLIYGLWVADYGMSNAGDLDTSAELYAPFQSDILAAAQVLNLPRTSAAFSLPVDELQRQWFHLFDGLIAEARGVEE